MPPEPFSVLKRYLPAIIFLLLAAVLITWLGCKRASEGEKTDRRAPKSRTERSNPRPRSVADTHTPAVQAENAGAPVAVGGYRMKITQIWNSPRELPSGRLPTTADPCGWKELQQPGKQGWYRLFVQTKIANDAKMEPDSLFQDLTVTFSAQGRYASVPCDGNQDLVDPPAEASVGNGINSWSAWHNWTITVNVHCDANSGVITTRKSRTRGNAQWGDTFDDGFRLMLELKEGEANTVVCRALSTHPLVDRDDTAVGVPKKTSAARFLSTQESSR